MKKEVKVIIVLQIILFMYSLFGICSKFAAQQEFLSFKFILFYGIVLVNLAVYAVCWQQIIKRLPLVTAYANKAVTVIWGLVWGVVFFREQIAPAQIIGAIIIIIGIVLVVTEKEENNG